MTYTTVFKVYCIVTYMYCQMITKIIFINLKLLTVLCGLWDLSLLTEPMSSAVEAESLNYWLAREVPSQ